MVRILQDLTARVRDRADDLAQMAEILGELDAVQAMAPPRGRHGRPRPRDRRRRAASSWSTAATRCSCPAWPSDSASTRTEEPVPVSLRVGGDAGAGAGHLRPQHRRQDGGPEDGGAVRPHGPVRPARPGRPGQRAAGLPPGLRRHRRRPVDRREPLDVLRAPRGHRGDDPRPRAARPWCCSTRWAPGPTPPRGGPSASPSWSTSASAGPWSSPPPTTALMKAYAQSTPGVGCGSFGYDPRDLGADLPADPRRPGPQPGPRDGGAARAAGGGGRGRPGPPRRQGAAGRGSSRPAGEGSRGAGQGGGADRGRARRGRGRTGSARRRRSARSPRRSGGRSSRSPGS